jgi:general secretion pathway protein G
MKRVAGISSKKSGFTLLELLIVMAILIVVIGMLGTTVWGQYRKALIRTATVQVQDKLTNALELFYLDFKRYPDQNYEGLYILADIDNPNAPQQQQPQQQQGMQGQQGMQSPNGMMDGMYGATGGMGGDMNSGMYGTNGNMAATCLAWAATCPEWAA